MTTLTIVGIAIALFGLVPVRRLHLAGWPPARLAAYWATLIVLGLVVAEMRGPARLLVPVFLALYITPFVTWRAGIARILDRNPGGGAPSSPPVRTVGSSGFDDQPATGPDPRAPHG